LTFYDAQKFAAAIHALKQAIRHRPDYAEAHNDLGLNLAAFG
jgi:Flp pilus assembly protein TadD